MAGIVNWKKATIITGVPASDHLYVGIDSVDGLLYFKNSAGLVTKYVTLASLSTVATSGDHVDLLNKGTNTHAQIDSHIANVSNPHSVTKTQVGLSNVDNTSDANKPVSTAQQTALNLKADLTLVGAANGIAPLDASQKVPAANLPSYVDDVLEYANLAAFPGTGETGKMYVAIDTGKIYRWSGSIYVEISASPGSTDAVPEGVTNLYFTTARVLATALTGLSLAVGTAITAADSILVAFGKLQKQITDNLTTLSNHISNTSNPHATTAVQVGAEPTITGTTSADFWSGAKTFINFATTVRGTILTGLSLATSTAITATDSVLVAFGKLQAQATKNASFGYAQYTNGADRSTTVLKTTFTKLIVENDVNSFLNGFFTKINTTDIQTDFNGYVRIDVKAEIQNDSTNDRPGRIVIIKNGVEIPQTSARTTGKTNLDRHGSAATQIILPCAINDNFSVGFGNAESNDTITIRANQALITIAVARVT